jgi:hypothetical protein
MLVYQRVFIHNFLLHFLFPNPEKHKESKELLHAREARADFSGL